MAGVMMREFIQEKTIKYIAHVSDIHIGSKPDRYKEYSNVLDAFAETITNFSHKDELLIVITGDTCHWKSRLAPEDILCFDRFMTQLHPLPILIIPGNHDTVINNKNREDLMTPLVSRYRHVIYSKNSEAIRIGDLDFFHVSVYDGRTESEIFTDLEQFIVAQNKERGIAVANSADVNKTLDNKIRGYDPADKNSLPIFLYHGFVDGAMLGSHMVSGCKISRRIMNVSRMVLLGDIHESQFITPTCAYAGSLIQQNVSEGIEKGFILWSLEKNKGRFVAVPNQRMMVRVDYRAGAEGIKIYDRLTVGLDAAARELLRKNITRVTIITESYGAALETQIREVKTVFGRLDNISTVDNGLSTRFNTITSAAPVDLEIAESVDKTGPNPGTIAGAINNAAGVISARLSPLETQIETIKQLVVEKADSVIAGLSAPEYADDAARSAKILDVMNKIITLHRSHVADMPVRRWTIKAMRWDNILIYGEGNFIDFEEIARMGKTEGSTNTGIITGCIAPNRSGKSSIFDILVFALFGSYLRGDRKSIFHKGTTNLSVRVDFEVNGTDYFIERSDLNAKTSSIKLCKLTKSVGGAIREENITAETIPETYVKMQSLIGTLDDFLATGLFYDNENDIIRLSKTSRRETLARLFGLVDNERIIKEEKKKIKEYVAALADVESRLKSKSEKSSSGVDFSLDLRTIQTKNNTMRAQLATAEQKQKELQAEAATIDSTWHSQTKEIEEIKQYNGALSSLNNLLRMDSENLLRGDNRMRELKTLIEQRLVELPKGVANGRNIKPMSDGERAVCMSIIKGSMPEVTSEQAILSSVRNGELLASLRSQLTDTSSELSTITSSLNTLFGGSIPNSADTALENTKSTLAACKKQLLEDEAAQAAAKLAASNILKSFSTTYASSDELATSDVAGWHSELLTNIITAERSKNAIGLDKCKMTADAAERAVNAAMQKTKYTFSDSCTDCKKNLALLSSDLAAAQTDLARAKENHEKAQTAFSEITEKIAVFERKRNNMESLLTAMKKADAETKKVSELGATISALEIKITKFETSAVELSKKAVLEKHVQRLREQITAAESIYGDYARTQYTLTREELDLAAELPKLRATVSQTQEKATEYKNKIQSLPALTQALAEVTTRKQKIREQITQQSELMGQLKLLIEETEEFIDLKSEYDLATPRLKADIELHSAYVTLLGAKGLQTQVIKRNINSVIAKINAVLTAITTFRVAIEVSDTKINLFISDSIAGDLTKDIPIELASGFQKFVISLIFRLSLTHSLFTASKFVICDESFSTFDQTNLSHVPELLNAVKGFYDFVFIISHIELLQQCVEIPIYINVEERIEAVSTGGDKGATPKKETRGRKVKDTQKDSGPSYSALSVITSYVRSPEGCKPRPYTIIGGDAAKDAEKEKQTEKIKCACGAEIQRKSIDKHAQSVKHKTYLEKAEKQQKTAALLKK